MSAEYHQAVRVTQANLDRLVARTGIARARGLLRDMEADLEHALAKSVAAGQAFTAHQQRAMLLQVKAAMVRVQAPMSQLVRTGAIDAMTESAHALARQVAALESHFSGAVVPVPLLDVARLRGLVDRRATSLLVQHERSMARYGAAAVARAERSMARSMATGASHSEAVDDVVEAVGAERWRAERIVRTECLLGDTLVSGAVVRAAHRRWFEGCVAEIVTGSGRHLTATTNHPMLTRRGWVGAGELTESDDLVCYVGQENARAACHEDVAAPPSTIAEVFDALLAVGIGERRGTAQPDFHGDGMDGQVDIFRSDRSLPIGLFAPFDEPLAQDLLSTSDLTRSRFCTRCLLILSVDERSCRCRIPHLDPGLAQSSRDGVAAGVQRLGDSDSALACQVSRDDRRRIEVGPPSRGSASSGDERRASVGQRARDASGPDNRLDPSSIGAHRSRDFARAQPGEVQLDRVSSVRLRPFCGHVYNLTTEYGYFCINGVYTGNTSYAVNAGHAIAIQDEAVQQYDLWQRWSEHCEDGTPEPMDDRVAVDSIALHGQVAHPGGLFTQPPTAPVPDSTGQTEVPASLAWETWPHPPNRPHDRAVLTPWKASWGVPGWRWQDGRRVPVTERDAPPRRSQAAAPPPAPEVEREPAPRRRRATPPAGFNDGGRRVRTGPLPAHADVTERVEDRQAFRVPIADIADRLVALPGGGADKARVQSIRDAWAKGRALDPVKLTVLPDGRLMVDDGRHRLLVAAEQGREVLVRVAKGVAAAGEGVVPLVK